MPEISQFQKNKIESDRTRVVVQAIFLEKFGTYTTVPDDFLDVHQASDLVTDDGHHVPLRVRSPKDPDYLLNYRDEFTIRALRTNSGMHTEYTKIVDYGFGRFFFYGHRTETWEIPVWCLLDLDIFRAAMDKYGPHAFGSFQHNKDGTKFWAFEISSFLNTSYPILVAHSDDYR